MDIFEYSMKDVEDRYLNNKEFQPEDTKEKKPIGLYAQKELFCILNFAVWKKVYGMTI